MYIKDLYNLETAQLFECKEFLEIHSHSFDFLEYNALIASIPRAWKDTIKKEGSLVHIENPIKYGKQYT